MKNKMALFTIFSIIALGIAACSPKQTETDNAPVVPAAIIAEGQLLPVQTLDLSFTVSGQIADVLVDNGMEVRKGQVLARLVDSSERQAILAGAEKEALAAQQTLDDYKEAADVNLAQGKIDAIIAGKLRTTARNNFLASSSREAQARLDEADGNLAIAEEALARLEANGGLDPDQLNTLEAQVEAANANVASGQDALDALELKADMTGTIADVRIIPGQRVEPGEVAMAIADFSEWIIETDNLTEIEVVDIVVGQEVEVVLDALPDVILKGEVSNINTRFEEKRGDVTYTVTVVLKETSPLMRWGMTAAVRFEE